jgi:predicted DNA-binding transcriptional regulator AlpA
LYTPEPLPRAAYSIREFCAQHNLSRGTYYRLRAQGRAPREMRFGGKLVLISQEAARDWRKRHTDNPATTWIRR